MKDDGYKIKEQFGAPHHFKIIHLAKVFTVGLGLLLCFSATAQTAKPVKYKIAILRWGLMFYGDATWKITEGDISIKMPTMRRDSVTNYLRNLSIAERQTIFYWLSKIDLQKIEKENVNNTAPDDMGEYDFAISVNHQSKKFHIYQVKIDAVFNLVKQINLLLPAQYQIGYNDSYFRFK